MCPDLIAKVKSNVALALLTTVTSRLGTRSSNASTGSSSSDHFPYKFPSMLRRIGVRSDPESNRYFTLMQTLKHAQDGFKWFCRVSEKNLATSTWNFTFVLSLFCSFIIASTRTISYHMMRASALETSRCFLNHQLCLWKNWISDHLTSAHEKRRYYGSLLTLETLL